MNHVIRELPPYERILYVKRGEVVPFVLPEGMAMVKIHHIQRICNFIIFFGVVGEEFVHGYLDYEKSYGGIATDE